MLTALEIIKQYKLLPHPEGGWYKETYRSSEYINTAALPERFTDARSFSTAIYFLLEQGNFSAFHRIKSDECWHFYGGGMLHIYVISPGGSMQIIKLGNDIYKDELFQYVVPANCWFASRPAPGNTFSFTGCTVSPGFDFADFELATTAVLSEIYPQHTKIINELCR